MKLAAKFLEIGGNTIEFMFHPNGDISGLKIIKVQVVILF